MTEIWPLFGLDIRTPTLRLRAMREADALALAATLPPDLEQDPSLPRFELGDARKVRAATSLQGYWRCYGSWQVENWCLPFSVWHGNQLIGSQTLEGEQFLERRVVDSASYLLPEFRGRGLGTQMRRAVLTLAFGKLAAEWAVSSAWSDNLASLGVSRTLGYEANGLSRHVHEGKAGTLTHVLLTRERWEGIGGADGVTVSGFLPCRGLFGI